MALTIVDTQRQFKIVDDDKDLVLDDPNPKFSIEEVRKFYSSQYPQITNANTTGPVIEDDKAIYTFNAEIGTKG